MMSSIPLVFVLAQATEAAERAAGGLGPFALTFMLVSMAAVTGLMLWCFAKILAGREHFDPDGTGPAKPPVPGKADRLDGPHTR